MAGKPAPRKVTSKAKPAVKNSIKPASAGKGAGKTKPTPAGGKGKPTISQSDTRWVKPKGKPGYVVQISTGKKVTGNVSVVTGTKTNKAGSTASYTKGKNADWKPSARSGGEKGSRPVVKKATASKSSSGSSKATVTKPTATKPNAGVKVGTVRRGAAGRVDNRWNGKKWVPVVKPAVSAATADKPKGRTPSVGASVYNSQVPKPPKKTSASGNGSASTSKPSSGGSKSGTSWAGEIGNAIGNAASSVASHMPQYKPYVPGASPAAQKSWAQEILSWRPGGSSSSKPKPTAAQLAQAKKVAAQMGIK